jgi:Protein of unknown function (DUF3224)
MRIVSETSVHASATFRFESWNDEATEEPGRAKMGEVPATKTYPGDIEGLSTTTILMALPIPCLLPMSGSSSLRAARRAGRARSSSSTAPPTASATSRAPVSPPWCPTQAPTSCVDSFLNSIKEDGVDRGTFS